MPIRVIIETFTSKRDRNGNCYHAATITSMDGRSLLVAHVGGERNIPSMFSSMGLEWSEIHATHSMVGYRELQQISKGGIMEHEAKQAAWHMLPHDFAVIVLAHYITTQCKAIAKAVEAENDGSMPESYRNGLERHGDKCRNRLGDIAQAHGVSFGFPGVFPSFNIKGKDWTATDSTDNRGLAEAILALPCKAISGAKQ